MKDSVAVVTVSGEQTGFFLSNFKDSIVRYFIDIPSEFLKDIQEETKKDIPLKVIRNGICVSEGSFSYSTGNFFLPVIIPEYFKKKGARRRNKAVFLTCYMFQPGDIIEFCDLAKNLTDKIFRYDIGGIMDYSGYMEDLDEFKE
jgi:hypothetical protein